MAARETPGWDYSVPNRDKTPLRRSTVRTATTHPDLQPAVPAAHTEVLRSWWPQYPWDLATGRGLTYEWEYILQDLTGRVEALESGTGGTGGTSTGNLRLLVHNQTTPAATWSITHGWATKPEVLVISPTGTQFWPQIDFPDNYRVAITHAQPYAGTAYLRG